MEDLEASDWLKFHIFVKYFSKTSGKIGLTWPHVLLNIWILSGLGNTLEPVQAAPTHTAPRVTPPHHFSQILPGTS